MYRYYILLLLSGALSQQLKAQNPFQSIFLKVDTMEFSQEWYSDQGVEPIRFRFDQPNETMEVIMELRKGITLEDFRLLPSGDFSLIDSMRMYEQGMPQFKIQFRNLQDAAFLKLPFEILSDTTKNYFSIPLQPYTNTYAELYPPTEELFIGEEKIFEITTNDDDNLVVDNRWTNGRPIDYRFTRQGQTVRIHVKANQLGQQMLSASMKVKQPVLAGEELVYALPPITHRFVVKEGRLAFLQIDQQEITPNEDRKEPIEIQIDNNRYLELNKTYRIEDQEERGGALIAELYTRNRLNNDKILATLRVYALHRRSQGYLYIKDGDQPRFVTNVDITPRTKIDQIQLQRNGEDWENSNVVYPGETLMVRLVGKGLHKANFTFEGVENLTLDSLVRTENLSDFRLRVPDDVSTRSIEIFNSNEHTGSKLVVKEYKRPRDFDYLTLELNEKNYIVNRINKPIFFPENLTDLVINFNRNLIDVDGYYGKQYLTIDIRVSNKEGGLIELYKLENVVVCPGSSSVRSIYYEQDDCSKAVINLNNYLSKKTYDLEEWSKIDIEIKHVRDEYDGKGETKRIQVYLQRDYNFDIDVSFPAGLLIFEGGDDSGETNATNFGGVSFAMLAQFSFYKPGRIAKYRPYKVGAGFIAIDAFNFSNSDNANSRQDIAAVIIGSLYPTSSDRKLTFPLFMGFGYRIRKGKPFFLLGPGIRVRL